MKKLNFSKGITQLVLVLFVGATMLLSFGQAVSSAMAEKRHIALGTAKEGSAAYSCGVALAASIKKRLKDISMEAVPTPGSTASVKLFGKKATDVAYSNTRVLKDAYNNTGAFSKKPIERKPLQGWYYLSCDWIPTTKVDRKDINSLKDMAGKKFFPYSAGSGVYDVYKVIFTKLGLWDKMKIRQLGLMEAADALNMGTIDVTGGVCFNRGLMTNAYMRNIDARVEIKVIVASPKEQEIISSIPGLSCQELSNQWMRSKNQAHNSGKLWGWSVHYGWHPGPDMPTEVFYKVYKTWIEHAKKDLAPVNATLKYYANNAIELQLKAIEEGKAIPVHPGVAKYLKEKGLWKSDWIVGKLNPGVN